MLNANIRIIEDNDRVLGTQIPHGPPKCRDPRLNQRHQKVNKYQEKHVIQSVDAKYVRYPIGFSFIQCHFKNT